MNSLVERLRAHDLNLCDEWVDDTARHAWIDGADALVLEAADRIEELEAELAEAKGFAAITQKANAALAEIMIKEGVLVPHGPTMEDILREQLERPNFPRLPKSSYANKSSGGFEDSK